MASQSFQLVMKTGPNPGKVFELDQDELTIGRDISNLIVINDPEVSRRHARLTAQAGGYVIEDLGSTNGTFVDGQRLMGPHMLRIGETIMFGEKVSLRYETLGYDQDATLVGAPAAQPSPQPPPSPQPSPDTYRVPPSQDQAYAPPPAPEPVPPPSQEAYPPIPKTELVPQVPDYQPVYSGQVPPGPAEPYVPPGPPPLEPYAEPYGMPVDEEAEKPDRRTWLYVGCGCLVVLLCICLIGAYAFDAADLYCEQPFNVIFEALGFVCE